MHVSLRLILLSGHITSTENIAQKMFALQNKIRWRSDAEPPVGTSDTMNLRNIEMFAQSISTFD